MKLSLYVPQVNGVCIFFFQDMAIHVYELNNNTLVEKTDVELKLGGQITDLKYSPDGAYLASCDANRRLTVFKMPAYEASGILRSSGHCFSIMCV